jgi:hypothetical protein
MLHVRKDNDQIYAHCTMKLRAQRRTEAIERRLLTKN